MDAQIERVWAVKNIRNAERIHAMHVIHFFENLPEEKLDILRKAELRNDRFTSDDRLEHVTTEVYQEGVYFKLTGCQSAFTIYCDFNGDIKRKPSKHLPIRTFCSREYR